MQGSALVIPRFDQYCCSRQIFAFSPQQGFRATKASSPCHALLRLSLGLGQLWQAVTIPSHKGIPFVRELHPRSSEKRCLEPSWRSMKLLLAPMAIALVTAFLAVACASDAPEPGATSMPTPTATSVPSPEPAATTESPIIREPGFGDGTWIVGTDVGPGIYAAAGGTLCYWSRLSGFGGSLGEIIANEVGGGRTVVTIAPEDKGFETTGCGDWRPVFEVTAPLSAIPEGTWLVGDEIPPGTYSAEGGDLCYWARLNGFSGELGDIIANNVGAGKQVAEIMSADAGFSSGGCGTCGTWTRATSPDPIATTGPAPTLCNRDSTGLAGV